MRLAVLLITLLFMVPAQAETLTIIVQSMNSQPYHNAKLLGKYMVKHYDGASDVAIKVVPGANGLNAANYLYNVAPKDGLTFGTFTRIVPLLGIVGDKNAQYDTRKFNWIGSTTDNRSNPGVLISRKKYDNQLVIGEQGSLEGGVVDLIQSVSGWNIKKVVGYRNVPDIRLAFEQGEIDAYFNSYADLLATRKDLKDNIILQYGNGLIRHPELKDVPTLMELARDDQSRRLLAIRELSEILVKPFVAPPGVSAEKIGMLREAFFKAVNDADYIKESEKMNFGLSPVFWSQAEFIIRLLDSNRSYLDPT
jgi:hypothetical protein